MSKATYEETHGVKSNKPAMVKELADAGIGIKWADDIVTYSIGKKDDTITTITLDVSSRPYTDNVVAPLVERKRTIKESFDANAAAKEFLK